MKKFKKKLLSIGIACTLLMLTGCGTKEQKPSDDLEPLADPGSVSSMDFPQGDEISTDFGTEMNLLAFDLYDKLDHTDNLFFSPYSICSALSMLENSAGTTTKDELDSLLYIRDKEQRNSDLKLFAESFTDDQAVLNTANSLWVSIHLDVKDDAEENFFAPVKYYYNADVYQADFTDETTVDAINGWISDKTEEMIPHMLNDLSPNTKMCLVNAVYFKGEWTKVFELDDTYTQDFYGVQGTSSVDMMHQYGNNFKYVEAEGMKGIRLPYGEGSIAMDIWICEDESQDIDTLFSGLSAEERCELFSRLDNASYEEISILALPKFTVEGETISLKDALSALGMEESFSDAADFDIINDSLYVSDVLHQAKIEVDECGTVAAAATVVVFTENAMEVVPTPTYDFVADHPFIYCIRDYDTGAILFLGIVNNL